jgi:hypothetical protein
MRGRRIDFIGRENLAACFLGSHEDSRTVDPRRSTLFAGSPLNGADSDRHFQQGIAAADIGAELLESLLPEFRTDAVSFGACTSISLS